MYPSTLRTEPPILMAPLPWDILYPVYSLTYWCKMKDAWESDATSLDQYHQVECKRGREFIIRLTTGADVYKAIKKFAVDKNITFGKIHAAFMGGFSPAKMAFWVPDTQDPENWHMERNAQFDNLSMLISMSGMIHTRLEDGNPTPFPAIHYVIGELGMCQQWAATWWRVLSLKAWLRSLSLRFSALRLSYQRDMIQRKIALLNNGIRNHRITFHSDP